MTVTAWWFPPPAEPAASSIGTTTLDHLHSPLMLAADLLSTTVPAEGGAGKFGHLSRGMLVVDEEAWEEEGVILPLTLDTFP